MIFFMKSQPSHGYFYGKTHYSKRPIAFAVSISLYRNMDQF